MIGNVGEFGEMPTADAAAGLLFIEEGLHEQRRPEDLVPGAVREVGAGDVGGADRLALAAAEALLDGGGDLPHLGLLQDQGFRPQEAEGRGVGTGKVAA